MLGRVRDVEGWLRTAGIRRGALVSTGSAAGAGLSVALLALGALDDLARAAGPRPAVREAYSHERALLLVVAAGCLIALLVVAGIVVLALVRHARTVLRAVGVAVREAIDDVLGHDRAEPTSAAPCTAPAAAPPPGRSGGVSVVAARLAECDDLAARLRRPERPRYGESVPAQRFSTQRFPAQRSPANDSADTSWWAREP